ncbi:MAG: NYN domain-containing protein [Thermoanaerobaculia bacterium]|jgi:predicted RNA-binding protein with PIN domain
MRYVIDGSNLLGALGLPRETDEAKRALVQRLASFARASHSRVDCVFDGARPEGFPTSFGGLGVRFSHPQSGDDVIVKIASSSTAPATVVTNDRALGSRVKSRKVRIESCAEFRARLDTTKGGDDGGSTDATDWESYFSDPKNRNV